ncbi:MAG: hypothetical protein A2096_15280 [Spirochaetes bacterium GWF1_41_5]|nr:MAG: hypothetical protein A2096_15280 [Spirochaetes bacterium GWF1_41_5]HBE02176.1 hypothetical protein [Spirochaetia bacterium]
MRMRQDKTEKNDTKTAPKLPAVYIPSLIMHQAFLRITVPEKNPSLHSHDNFEFHYFAGGTGCFFIEHEKIPVKQGDFIFLRPGEMHHLVTGSAAVTHYIIHVSFPESEVLPIDMHKRICGRGMHFRYFFERLLEKFSSGNHQLSKSAACDFLSFLYELSSGRKRLEEEVIENALDYLHADPARRLRLDELSAEIRLEKFSLIRKFKLAMGVTPMQYALSLKLQFASELLIKTDHSIGAIAREIGYDEESSFSRAFKKKFGKYPKLWKTQKRE